MGEWIVGTCRTLILTAPNTIDESSFNVTSTIVTAIRHVVNKTSDRC